MTTLSEKLTTSQERVYIFIFSIIFLTYIIGRVVSAFPALKDPRQLADTTAYLRISSEPVQTSRFWGESRPFAFPLLLKIAHQNFQLASTLQLGLSILCWGFLAWMVMRFLRHVFLQLFAFTLTLLFSLDRHIASWDFVMMTESLSISFLVLFIAVSLWLLQQWNIGRVVVLIISAFLLAFVRDTNAWLLLLLAGLILFPITLRWIEPRTLILVFSFVAIFLISNFTADLGGRWVFPLGNLIGRRILPDESAVEFFNKTCSMPVSPALLNLSGGFANVNDRALYNDPELEPFRAWLLSHGKSCYIRWLITNFANSLRETLNEFESLITFPTVDRFFSKAYDPLMPVGLGKFFYPERFAVWIWGYSTLASLAAVWTKSWRENPLWAVFICLNLLVFPHLFLVWHGDAMAPDRHALCVGIQLYLSFWILNILLADHFWHRHLENLQIENFLKNTLR
jgi:hypothetical protein